MSSTPSTVKKFWIRWQNFNKLGMHALGRWIGPNNAFNWSHRTYNPSNSCLPPWITDTRVTGYWNRQTATNECYRACPVRLGMANCICTEDWWITMLLYRLRKDESRKHQEHAHNLEKGRISGILSWSTQIINDGRHFWLLWNWDRQTRKRQNDFYIT